MKILFALTYPNALSESYMRTELDWSVRQGVDAFVWARREHCSGYPLAQPHAVGVGLGETIRSFKPEGIHVHWMTLALDLLPELEAAGVPVTVRGHSFDYSRDSVERLAASPVVHRIFLYPHQKPELPKTEALPACFDPAIYHPGPEAGRRRVFRAAAGLPGKGLEEFVGIARACPSFSFQLAMTRASGNPGYVDLDLFKGVPNLQVTLNRTHEQVAAGMQESAIYLRGHDPERHPYGMPVSIAEAMASGCFIVGREDRAATAYVGDAGTLYGTAAEAVQAIESTAAWTEEEWRRRREISLRRAARFTAESVLPPLLACWRGLPG